MSKNMRTHNKIISPFGFWNINLLLIYILLIIFIIITLLPDLGMIPQEWMFYSYVQVCVNS